MRETSISGTAASIALLATAAAFFLGRGLPDALMTGMIAGTFAAFAGACTWLLAEAAPRALRPVWQGALFGIVAFVPPIWLDRITHAPLPGVAWLGIVATLTAVVGGTFRMLTPDLWRPVRRSS
jgi:predicted ABC-type sugar transport system permease subunit